MKRGRVKAQITIFIIVAIVIIVALATLFFFLQNQNQNNVDTIPQEIQPVYDYVEECAMHTAYDGLIYVANTGGYFIRQDSSNDDGVAYYYLNNQNYVPTKQQLAQELSLYMNNLLPFCTAGFSPFADYIVEEDEIKTQAVILNDKIMFKINYPLSIKKVDQTTQLENFQIEIPVRLATIQTVADSITDNIIERPICITCIQQIADENQVYVNMMQNENEFLITITDPHSQVYEQNYSFNFAGRYNNAQ